ncbi:MAG: 3'(2'),5'-bisphosphate nucleotidase CysQ [Hyphomicrobiales bacterium]|nr:3'(2'),5'-bisphosphate nucleotidase CysQ [Hyphomicrobiales bacterium]
MAPSSYLFELLNLAQEAGREVIRIYNTNPESRQKQDSSPVTDADIAAEKIILAGLAKLEPDTSVIAEEAVAAGAEPVAADRFYLVDPLDGTREFISRNGEFTINIALIENGLPTAGVVYAPAIGRVFCGATGSGSFTADLDSQTDVGECIWRSIETRAIPDDGAKVVASRSHRDERTNAWIEKRKVSEIVSAGSSLKFCLVAAAEADLYPRFGRTMEWDTAAGHAVLSAAGGNVVCEDGTPLTYGKHQRGFDNPGFIAFGDPACDPV